MKLLKPKDASEHSIQRSVVDYLTINARPEIFFFSVPNGGLRSLRVAIKLKAEGLRPGVSDLIILMPKGRCAFLELKTRTGRLSDTQLGFKARCLELEHSWGMARSLEEAIRLFVDWNILKRPVATRDF